MKQSIHPIFPGAIPGQVRALLVILLWGLILLTFLIWFTWGVADAQTKNSVANSHTSQDKLSLAAGICVTRAQALFQNGEVRRAISLLEEFKNKKAANHYYIHFLLGNYYLTFNQTQSAVLCFEASVQQNPAFYAGWLNLAKSLYESGLFARAGVAFENGYKCSQISKPIHLYYAGICYFQAGDPQKALAVFELLIQAHPDKISLGWKESLVNILFSLERYSQALPILEELAVKIKDERKKKWQEILLYQYLNLKMEKKALAFAKVLTRTNPLEPKWWKALCQIHLNNNQYKQGVSALVIYGYLTPMTHEELMLAGDLYLGLDVPVKAARLYQAAIKETQTPEYFLKISQACVMAHEPDKALAWVEKGLSVAKDVRLLHLKARILYRQKNYARAADAYECLVEALLTPTAGKPDPKTLGQAWLMLGYAALNQNSQDPNPQDQDRLVRAHKAFSKAAVFKSQKKSARAALGQIKILETHTIQQENTYAKKTIKK
jgi:tetratricopeptide (TPR) repeat protein